MPKARKEQIVTTGGIEGDVLEVDAVGNYIFAPNDDGSINALSAVLNAGNTTDGYNIDFTVGNQIIGSDGYIDFNVLTTGAESNSAIRFLNDGIESLRFEATSGLTITIADDVGDFNLTQSSTDVITAAAMTFRGQATDTTVTGPARGGAASLIGGQSTRSGGSGNAFGGASNVIGGLAITTTGAPVGGDASIIGGATSGSIGTHTGGNALVTGGTPNGTGVVGLGGNVIIAGGVNQLSGSTGTVTIRSGNAVGTGPSGIITINSGTAADGDTGDVTISTSSVTGTNRIAGDLTLQTGGGDGVGQDGYIHLNLVTGATLPSGRIFFEQDGAPFMTWDPNASLTATVSSGAGNFTLLQDDDSTNDVTGSALLIHAQNVTGGGTANIGGAATFNAGDSTGVATTNTGGTATFRGGNASGGSTNVGGDVVVAAGIGASDQGDVLFQAAGATQLTVTDATIEPGTGQVFDWTNGEIIISRSGTQMLTSSGTSVLNIIPTTLRFSAATVNPIFHQESTSGTAGDTFTINAQDLTGTGTSVAGPLVVRGGNTTGAGSLSKDGGTALFAAGDATGATSSSNTGGITTLRGGNASAGGTNIGGDVIIAGGTGATTAGTISMEIAGVNLLTGSATAIAGSLPGIVFNVSNAFTGISHGLTSGDLSGNTFGILGSSSTDDNAGNITIAGGTAGGSGDGGNATVSGGTGAGAGLGGDVILNSGGGGTPGSVIFQQVGVEGGRFFTSGGTTFLQFEKDGDPEIRLEPQTAGASATLDIKGQDTSAAGFAGGEINITGGDGAITGGGGLIQITGGNGGTDGNAGGVLITGGTAFSTTGSDTSVGGGVSLTASNSTAGATGGDSNGSAITIRAGAGAHGSGGSGGDGGNVDLRVGAESGAGALGQVRFLDSLGSPYFTSDTNTTSIIGDGYISGKLTVAGLIDPTGMIFEEAGPPGTSGTEGAIFVSDGTSGLTQNSLYYQPLNSGTPVLVQTGAGGGGGAGTLAEALSGGDTTDGYDIDFTVGSEIVGSDGYADINVLTSGVEPNAAIRFFNDGTESLRFEATSGLTATVAHDVGNFELTQANAEVLIASSITVRGQATTDDTNGPTRGGNVSLIGGLSTKTGGAGNAFGGDVVLTGGVGTSTTNAAIGGNILITAGDSVGSVGGDTGGIVQILGGDSTGSSAGGGGQVTIAGGINTLSSASGAATLRSGNAVGTGASGTVTVNSGTTVDGDTGDVTVSTSNVSGSNRSAGDLTLQTGSGDGVGIDGYIHLNLNTGATLPSGRIFFEQDGAPFMTWDPNASLTATVGSGAGNFTLTQAADTTSDATGSLLTISAQDVTGAGTTNIGGGLTLQAGNAADGSATNEIGGDVTITSGTGDIIENDGYVVLQTGGTTVVSVASIANGAVPGLLFNSANSATTITHGSTTGDQSASSFIISGLTSSDNAGGQIFVLAGNGGGSGTGGLIAAVAGQGGTTGNGGAAVLAGGDGGATSGNGGDALVLGGGTTDGNGGTVSIRGHAGIGSSRTGGNVSLSAGASTTAVTGGAITLTGGAGGATGAGGGITLTTGAGSGGAVDGNIIMNVGATERIQISDDVFGDGYSGLGITGVALTFEASQVEPTISQEILTTGNAVTGDNLVISGQNTTVSDGSPNTGGSIHIRGGDSTGSTTGTNFGGKVRLQSGTAANASSTNTPGDIDFYLGSTLAFTVKDDTAANSEILIEPNSSYLDANTFAFQPPQGPATGKGMNIRFQGGQGGTTSGDGGNIIFQPGRGGAGAPGILEFQTSVGTNVLATGGAGVSTFIELLESLGTVATTGDIRTPHGFDLNTKTNAGSDFTLLSWGLLANDTLLVGNGATVNTTIRSGTEIEFEVIGVSMTVRNDEVIINARDLEYGVAENGIRLRHEPDTANDATGSSFIINAQDVTGGGTTITGGALTVRAGNSTVGSATNENGGDLTLSSGTGGAGTGEPGSISLTVGGNNVFVGDRSGGSDRIGFFNIGPVARASAYTRNATVVTDRTLLASASATTTNNNNVLAAIIADLQSYGLFQGT